MENYHCKTDKFSDQQYNLNITIIHAMLNLHNNVWKLYGLKLSIEL